MNLSAALAYNLLLATFPIIVAMLSILGLLFGILGRDATTFLLPILTSALPKEINSLLIEPVTAKDVAASKSFSACVLG